ncbi:hypothetical protein ISR94_02135 [Candidatus Microgenomates bacterium]|nr:hypothetical protein [Candidatus Microgenomates bacterium]
MIEKTVVIFSSIILALTILAVSIFRGATPRYAFSPATPIPKSEAKEEMVEIDYQLPYPGKVIPGDFLWYPKVLRDKLQYLLSFTPQKKAEFNLLCANKRLGMALMLFENGKPDLAYSTLTKSEKYLENVFTNNPEDIQFLKELSNASLKHIQVIEQLLVPLSPEDLQPKVIESANKARNSYNKARDLLRSKGEVAPTNPFESE